MPRDNSNWQRRNMLKLLGAGSVASVGGVGTAVAADDRVFTDDEINRIADLLYQRAKNELAAVDGIQKEDIPSWLPGLPTDLPFEYCADIPLLADFCTIAQAPVDIGGFSCNGVIYRGVKVSQSVAWGPNVQIEAGDYTGDIQYEASLDLLVDLNKYCPIALKVSSGGGQEACIVPPNSCSIVKGSTVIETANNVWDTVYDLVKGAFEAIGYIPPEEVLLAITALAAIAIVIAAGTAAAA